MSTPYQPNFTQGSFGKNFRFKQIRGLSLTQQTSMTNLRQTGPSVKINTERMMAQTLSRMNFNKFDGSQKKYPLDQKIEWDRNKAAHNELNDLRTKCDDILKKNQQTELEIDFIKKDLLYFKQQSKQYQESRNQIKNERQFLISSQEDSNYKLEDIFHQKKVYLNMRDRLRQDNIFLKKQVNQLYDILENKRSSIKIMENDEKKSMIKLQVTKINLQKATDNIQEITNERERHIQMINEDLIDNKNNQDQKEERKLQLQKLQLQAVDEKVFKEIEFQKLYNANKFLQHFLQKKIDRERAKFKSLEYTQQKIKTQTGISDAQQIFRNFKTREEQYESLLQKIQKLEQKKQQMLQRNNDLKEVISNQEADISIAEINLQNPIQNLNPQLQKRLEFMNQRSQKSEIQEIILKKYFNGVFNRLRLNDVHTQNYEQIKDDIVQKINAIYKRIRFLILNYDENTKKFSPEVPFNTDVCKTFRKTVERIGIYNCMTKFKKSPVQQSVEIKNKNFKQETKEQIEPEYSDLSENEEIIYIREQQIKLKDPKQENQLKKKDEDKKKEVLNIIFQGKK